MSDRSVGTGWVSAHLYFHGDLDDVIAHVVTPAVRAVSERPAGGQHFFLRYWEGGPHVRLRIRAADQDTAAVQHAIRRHAEDYFARNASATRVDAEAYRATRRWAMSLEPWTDPAAELSPNNSVRFVPYRREHHKYGHGPAMAAVEQHFTESSDIARDAVGARMVLVIAARFGRLMWNYEAMAYALVLKHVGVLYQTMYLVATAMGLAACGLGSGDNVHFAEATGIDAMVEDNVGEFMLGRPRATLAMAAR
jgi:Lantibiotic biosynthesis dehydratase C-term/Nitroreductase family